MGIYKVQANGKAPAGLRAGDQVVTGNGTYIITGVNPDGSYTSVLYNAGQSVANYRGGYDTAPGGGSGGSGSSAGSGMGSGLAGSSGLGVQQGGNDWAQRYLDLLQDTIKSSYQPAVSAPSAATQTISFAEAVKMAEQAMQPQFSERYQQAATNAAQRLEQAGLYDTLYGQSLAAQAENEITRDLNAAIYALALQLSDASEENARELLELAVRERQFGAEYDAEQRRVALDYLLKLLQ